MNARNEVTYDPNNLLDAVIKVLQLKNDAALCRALEVAPPVISKIRHGKRPVGASMLIRMHDVTQISIKGLRMLMGDRRSLYRVGNAVPKIAGPSKASLRK